MDNTNYDGSSMLQIGTLLHMGEYRIDRYLSSGGFGNTYLATYTSFNELVAIKEFFIRDINLRKGDSVSVDVSHPTHRSLFEEQREKFKTEALRLRKLHSPHIVGVSALFDENGTSYYVMDFIDGQSLRDMVKEKGHLDEEEVLDYLSQTLDALETVHKKEIFHLDMKPANIMVDKKGHVRVIDFGASKQQKSDGRGATSKSAVCYTPGYAPIEQREQEFENFGPWTDLYGLGATLYNVLTGNTPPSTNRILDRGKDAFNFPDTVSERMRELIFWTMKGRRNDRPQSVAEVRDFLKKHQADVPKPKEKPKDTDVAPGTPPFGIPPLRVLSGGSDGEKPEEKPKKEPNKKPEEETLPFGIPPSAVMPEDGDEEKPEEVHEEKPEEGPKKEPKEEPKKEPKEEPKKEPKEEPKKEPKEEPKKEPEENPEDETLPLGKTPLREPSREGRREKPEIGKPPIKEPILEPPSGKDGKKKWFIVAACAVLGAVMAFILIPNKESAPLPESEAEVAENLPTEASVDKKADDLVAALAAAKAIDATFKNDVFGEYKYTGPVEDDLPHGRGEATLKSGSYKGPFEHGVLQGADAEFVFKSGDVFKGSFKNNLFEKGVLTKADNGDYFNGDFQEGQPYNGTWYNKNGVKIGSVVNGKYR